MSVKMRNALIKDSTVQVAVLNVLRIPPPNPTEKWREKNKMKNIIRKWLGINNIVDSLMETRLRLTDLEAEVKKNEDGGQIFEGSTVKVDSLKEFVYGMAKYLKLQPRRTFKEVPVEPTTTKVERVYEVIKVK